MAVDGVAPRAGIGPWRSDGGTAYDGPETLARVETERGTLALRRRPATREERPEADGSREVYELIAGGTFAMDTVETSTERLLARVGLAAVERPRDVVVGGLGLGFTVAEVLTDHRVTRVDVVEMERAILDWVGAGLIPPTEGVLTDDRVYAATGDIAEWVTRRPVATVDVFLLDVDNGPDFLIHQENAGLYEDEFLRQVRAALRPDGCLAVWSADRSEPLHDRLGTVFGGCTERAVMVDRQGRSVEYVVYLAGRRKG